MTEGAEIDSLPLKIQDIQIQLSVQGKACHGDFFRITVCCSIVKGRQSQKGGLRGQLRLSALRWPPHAQSFRLGAELSFSGWRGCVQLVEHTVNMPNLVEFSKLCNMWQAACLKDSTEKLKPMRRTRCDTARQGEPPAKDPPNSQAYIQTYIQAYMQIKADTYLQAILTKTKQTHTQQRPPNSTPQNKTAKKYSLI